MTTVLKDKTTIELLGKFTYVADSVVIPQPKWKIIRALALPEQGLFAKKEIPANTYLGEYEGEEVTWETLGDRSAKYVAWKTRPQDKGHIFSHMRGVLGSTWFKFSNHASKDRANMQLKQLSFYTSRSVQKNEELTWCYGPHVSFK